MNRANRIAANCRNVDAVVICNGTSPFLDRMFWYVTEQTSGTFEGSFAIISKDGSLDVVTGRLEETTAKKGKGSVHIYESRKEADSTISDLLKGCRTVGVNGGSATHSACAYIKKIAKVKLNDISANIEEVVAVKDRKEISEIRKACAITSKTASNLNEHIYKGMTEKEAAWLIDSDMRRNGGSGNAFETIAAFGPNSAEPHYVPSDNKLKKGDAALFDFGTKYGMYCSDLTRTVFLSDPEDILRRAYDVVLKAKNAGMEKMFSGAPAKDADLAARDVIENSEFRGRFIHSFGHGVGMNIHESPSASRLSKDVLKEGMVVTAEPGVYLPGIGGVRIEDTVLITKNGAEALTEFDEGYTVI